VLAIAHPIMFVVQTFGQDRSIAANKFMAIVLSEKYQTGVISLFLLAVTVILSVYRARLTIRYEVWRGLHLLAGYLAFVLAVHHTLSVGTYASEPALKYLWLAGLLIVGGGLVFLYGIRPVVILRQVYEVSGRHNLSDDIVQLVLRPVKRKLGFVSGQFAWITVWPKLFPIFDHPFSFSSSPKDTHIEFLIRNAGDFTLTLRDLKVGTRVGLDGPHGDFVVPQYAESLVCVAGGIGISPILSILKDLSLSHDGRPIRLLYAGSEIKNLVALDEIRTIAKNLDFQMQIFSEERSNDPTIRCGRPTPDDFRDLIAGLSLKNMALMICGPGRMTASVSDCFEEIGLKRSQIYYEKFDYTDPAKSRKDRVTNLIFIAIFTLALILALLFAWRMSG
jgi:predicted ferric reductase